MSSSSTPRARKFGDYTAANVGALFAIVLDDEVIYGPADQRTHPRRHRNHHRPVHGRGIDRLAVLLRAGALPAEMEFLEERTIGPELGADSIAAGKVAALVGMAVVSAYMIASYVLFGVFAVIALGVNIGLIFAALSAVGGSLTLPGIAGIVLTIGMAVDANVLVFERIREELRAQKKPWPRH